MTSAIVARLKTGTISNVVPFGSPLPPSPYVVVKPEQGPDQTRWFRIIVHYEQGQQDFLEDYLFSELDDLLSDYEAEDRNGNTQHVYTTQEYSDILMSNEDNTISMERVFLVPQRLTLH